MCAEWNNGGNGNQQVPESDEDSSSDEEEMQGFSQMGLLNVRSMAKKAPMILDIILQKKLDILLTTETWLKDSNFEIVLQVACPPELTFYHEPRDGRTGGGVGIQLRKSYRHERIRFSNITIFEYVAVVLEKDEWDFPVLLVNVYFPPGYSRGKFNKFLSEFEMLLNDINGVYDHVIFTGDFNIHIEEKKKPYTIEFNDLLQKFGLEQYVDKKTHNRGRTLDLVLTRNVDVSNLIVVDPHISDHYIVIFMSIPVAPNKERKSLKKKKDKKN